MLTAKIKQYDGTDLLVTPDEPIDRELLQKQVGSVEIRLNDGRTISADQRRKVFAIIRDISEWSGHLPEELRAYLTWDFRSIDGIDDFSLSNVDMTTARAFITYLIGFCFDHNVPTKDTLLSCTDDISRYLYLCLEHRKCAICNLPAEVHHVDRIGMGGNRKTICHVGMKAIALCREHHEMTETDEKGLFEAYHIYGIKLDEYLCKVLKLGRNNCDTVDTSELQCAHT